jgi:hypothetical protein
VGAVGRAWDRDKPLLIGLGQRSAGKNDDGEVGFHFWRPMCHGIRHPPGGRIRPALG